MQAKIVNRLPVDLQADKQEIRERTDKESVCKQVRKSWSHRQENTSDQSSRLRVGQQETCEQVHYQSVNKQSWKVQTNRQKKCDQVNRKCEWTGDEEIARE